LVNMTLVYVNLLGLLYVLFPQRSIPWNIKLPPSPS
jgi:hypothetical protein